MALRPASSVLIYLCGGKEWNKLTKHTYVYLNFFLQNLYTDAQHFLKYVKIAQNILGIAHKNNTHKRRYIQTQIHNWFKTNNIICKCVCSKSNIVEIEAAIADD